MTTLADEPIRAPTAVRYRAVPYAIRQTLCERRADGTLILRSPLTPKATGRTGFAGYIPQWAERRGDVPAFCERDAHSGEWNRITWRALWQQVQAVGAALLELGLGQGRPLVVLSPNSLEQLVLLLAAEYVGVPVAPVSPAYSLLSREWGRFKVNVNAVAFGLIHTRMTNADAKAGATVNIEGRDIRVGLNPELLKSHAQRNPLGRGGTPEEAAGAVYLFCLPESNYITGQIVAVAGSPQ